MDARQTAAQIDDLLRASRDASAAAWAAHRADVVAIRQHGDTMIVAAGDAYRAYTHLRGISLTWGATAGAISGVGVVAAAMGHGVPWVYGCAPVVAWCTIRAVVTALRSDAALRDCQQQLARATAWLDQIRADGVTGTPDG